MNNKRLNNKGFTLVELLATIAVLALVMTIVIYTANNVITSSKEKSYQVTINNIQKGASSYVIENDNKIEWTSDVYNKFEYQCVMVQDLIDMAYFDRDVLESYVNKDNKVKSNDYVYLKRDANTKSLINNILLSANVDDDLKELCDDGKISATEDIVFRVSPSGWAKEKEVVIEYRLTNVDNVSNYKYGYSFSENASIKGGGNFNRTSVKETVTVNKNGTINANIKHDNDITSKSLMIGKIDSEAPKIEVNIVNGDTYAKSKDAIIKIVDSESGFKAGNYKVKYGWSTSALSCSDLKKVAVLTVKNNNEDEATMTINIDSFTGAGKLYVCGDNISDYVGNVISNDEVKSYDMYLDNESPVITLGTNGGKVRWTVMIPLKVTDNHSGVKGDSFVTSDVSVKIGSDTLSSSGYELEKVDNNNYNLVINNYTYAGKVSIIIDSNKVLDNVSNGNQKTELTTNVTFDNTYTISYYKNNGTGSMASTTCTYGLECETRSNNFTRLGYTFTGWNTKADGSGTPYKNNHKFDSYEFKTDLKLYAQWRINIVSIQYHVNGGDYTPLNDGWRESNSIIYASNKPYTTGIDYGATLTNNGLADYDNPSWINITKTGYSAVEGAEWICKSNNCKKEIYNQKTVYNASDFCDASNGDCTVTIGVNWVANTYKIKYDKNGGSLGSNAPTSGTYNSVVNISNPNKTVTVTGKVNNTGATIGSDTSKAQTFSGWTSSSADGLNTSVAKIGATSNPTTTWNGSATKNIYFKNLTSSNGGEVTLTATWIPVAFNLPTVSKTGYTCNWNTKSDGSGTTYTSGASYTPSANSPLSITMYARCTANKYPVNLRYVKYQDGEWKLFDTKEEKLDYGTSFTPYNVNAPTGYHAGNWYDYYGVGSSLIGSNKKVGVDAFIVNQAISVNVHYRPNAYTIKYDVNNGTGSMANTSCTYDSDCTLRVNGFNRTGYTFTGWNTKSDGSGTPYANSQKVKNLTSVNNGTVTLYAQWHANTVTIQYNVNGGTITKQTVTDGGTVNNWTSPGSIIYQNGSILTTSVNYGGTMDSNGLVDYDNPKWINITRTGYTAKSGEEWKCLSGCTTSNKTYNHSTRYKASDFCDASNGNCTVTLGVNWVDSAPPTAPIISLNSSGDVVFSGSVDNVTAANNIIYKGSINGGNYVSNFTNPSSNSTIYSVAVDEVGNVSNSSSKQFIIGNASNGSVEQKTVVTGYKCSRDGKTYSTRAQATSACTYSETVSPISSINYYCKNGYTRNYSTNTCDRSGTVTQYYYCANTNEYQVSNLCDSRYNQTSCPTGWTIKDNNKCSFNCGSSIAEVYSHCSGIATCGTSNYSCVSTCTGINDNENCRPNISLGGSRQCSTTSKLSDCYLYGTKKYYCSLTGEYSYSSPNCTESINLSSYYTYSCPSGYTPTSNVTSSTVCSKTVIADVSEVTRSYYSCSLFNGTEYDTEALAKSSCTNYCSNSSTKYYSSKNKCIGLK